MKKIGAIILTAVLLCTGFTTCYASEKSDCSEETAIDVYARCVTGDVVCRTEPVIDGEAQIELEEGKVISVTEAPAGAAVLKIIPVPASEKDAWEWIRSCLDSDIAIYEIYNIYFEDADGNRMNANGAKVSLASGEEDRAVYSIDISGNSSLLDSTSADGRIFFTTDGSHYYVITEGVQIPESEKPGNDSPALGEGANGSTGMSAGSENAGADNIGTSAKTGDNLFPQLSMSVFLIVLTAGLVVTVKKKI